MILVNGRTIYVRSETSFDWHSSIVLDAQIIALHAQNETHDKDAKMLCITEDSIQVIEIDHKKKELVCRKDKKTFVELPGVAVSV